MNSVQSDTLTQPKPRGKPGPKPKTDGSSRQRKPSGASVKTSGAKKGGTKEVKKAPKTPKSPAVLTAGQFVQNSNIAVVNGKHPAAKVRIDFSCVV